jgi:hypothetical protein
MFTYYFTPKGMTAEKYDSIIQKLQKAGAGNPKGRLYHVSFGDTSELRVMDVWDRKESFDEFGKTLMPVLNEVGVDPGEPKVEVVHNIIEAMAEMKA